MITVAFSPRRENILLMEDILHQLIGSLSQYLRGLVHPGWRSSTNSMLKKTIRLKWIVASWHQTDAFEVTLESILHRYGATDANVQFVAAEETCLIISTFWVRVLRHDVRVNPQNT